MTVKNITLAFDADTERLTYEIPLADTLAIEEGWAKTDFIIGALREYSLTKEPLPLPTTPGTVIEAEVADPLGLVTDTVRLFRLDDRHGPQAWRRIDPYGVVEVNRIKSWKVLLHG